MFLLAVSFSGFALSARLRKPSAEDLDNCTLENEFFLKASQEGKEAAEMQKKKPEKTKVSGENEANKSTGWMPRHHTPKKDAASCEKLRGVASRQ